MRGLGAFAGANHIENCLGMPGDDSQKNSSATFGLAAALLPISEGRRADAHEGREPGLAELVVQPNCPNIGFADPKFAERLSATAKDRPAFPYALPKLLEKTFLHRYSLSTICRNAFLWAVVKSTRSFFENAKSIKSRLEPVCQK
jgi:hypothetical protein